MSGGAQGTAPAGHLAAERRSIVGQAAARILRKANDASRGGGAIPTGAGSPLPATVKARMEPKLGADLSSVRVHTGGDSAAAASSFGARAFTVGTDVHFNAGQFAPGSKEGDRLLAHELTHVVQGQRSGVQRKAEPTDEKEKDQEVSQPGEPAEVEADAVADQVADSLHDEKDGDEKKGDAKKGDAKEKEKAPPIAAKLDGVGLKIFRAEDGKKRGDHLFNNGLKKLGGELPGLIATLPAKAKTPLDGAIATLTSCVSLPGFEITVNKGATPKGGDANSTNFGTALQTFRTALRAFVDAALPLDDAEFQIQTATDAAAEAKMLEEKHKALTTAGAALTTAWNALVGESYDAGCEPLMSKDQKKDGAAAKTALGGAQSALAAAIQSAVTAMKPPAAPPAGAAAAAAGGAPASKPGGKP